MVSLQVSVVGGPCSGSDATISLQPPIETTLAELQGLLESSDKSSALGRPIRWAWVPERKEREKLKPLHPGEWRGSQVKNWCNHPDRGGVFEHETPCEHPGGEIKADHWSCCGRVTEGSLGCRWPDGSPCGTVLTLERPRAPAGPEPAPGWALHIEGQLYDWDRTFRRDAAGEDVADKAAATLEDLGLKGGEAVRLVWRYGDEVRWYGAP
eukprot:Hpha_TRINITY_DN35254_c0_g1::TRINITY_DN35254_c0_g1_i1::g.145250::m.145250